ncbi:MAG: phage terminase small subunit P27 family [Opitutaceae bacterium]|nr:phage terminase small subunit P27 family [Opitutaceae bacterium]
MTGEARTEFRRVVRILTAGGVPPMEPDADAIERYARATVKERELFVALEAADWVTVGDRGGIKQHPKIAAWNACRAVCDTAAAAFGFTPAARSRLPKAGASGKSDNPLKAHLQHAR